MSPSTTLGTTARPLDAAQQELVEQHLSLVNTIARGWRRRCRTTTDFDELVQVGSMGLLDAARRFDPARGKPFAAMAAERVRGAICDHFRALDPLTRDRRKAVRRLETAASELRARLGREPQREELGATLGWDGAHVGAAVDDTTALAAGWARPHDPTNSEERGSLMDCPAKEPSALDVLLRTEQKEQLVEALGVLTERQRIVLDLYYREELQMHEIGDVLGVTESRVSQLRTAALAKLRTTLASPMAMAS
jgi:RNA polymerase sigma factor for flagellar operon FliA